MPAQERHQHQAEDDRQDRDQRHGRATERTWQVRTLLAQHDHGDRDQRERGQRADIDQLGQHRQWHHGSDQAKDNAYQPSREEWRTVFRVHLRQARRHQAVTRHREQDAGLAVGHHQHHGAHAQDRSQVDEAGDPVFTGHLQRQRHRMVDTLEVHVRHDAGHDRSDHDIQDGADDQRTDDADWQVARRILDFLGGRGDGVEADEGKEHQRGGAHHARHAVWHVRLPVFRLDVADTDRDEQQHDADLDDHHHVVQAGRLTHAERQQERDGHHDQEGWQVEQGLDARARAGGGGQRIRQHQAEARQQRLEITRPADRNGRGGQAVFEQQVPADHPGDEFAQCGVAVGIDGTGDRNGRGEFGVAQRGEAARHRRDDERQRQAGAGRDGAGAGQHEDTGADDGADAEQDQVGRAEHFLEAARLGACGDHRIQILGSKNTHYVFSNQIMVWSRVLSFLRLPDGRAHSRDPAWWAGLPDLKPPLLVPVVSSFFAGVPI